MPFRPVNTALVLAATALSLALPMPAQQEPLPPTDLYTLHINENLVQIPTLVLSPGGLFLPPIPLERFAVTLDAGPRFQPTHMHIEGDEPLSLSILLDATGDQREITPHIAAALAALAPLQLHPADHISSFAFDCKLIRSALNLPAEPAALESSIQRALTAPGLHGETPHRTCREISLWDAAARSIESIADLPGRRVLLILSDGHAAATTNPGSVSVSIVSDFAAAHAVAVFGLRWTDPLQQGGLAGAPSPNLRFPLALTASPREDLFETLCEQNGGLVLPTTAHDLPRTLQRLITMLRGRYILEFPRPDPQPDTDKPGKHIINVSLTHGAAFIRPAGVTYPPPATPDANTLPSKSSPATFGKRRPLPQ